jgi:hypothetical protein
MTKRPRTSNDDVEQFTAATTHRAKVLMGVVKQTCCCPHCAIPALAAALAAATRQAGDYALDEVCQLFRSLATDNDTILDHIAEGVECIPVEFHNEADEKRPKMMH